MKNTRRIIGTVALVLLGAGTLCAAGTSDTKTFSLYTASGAARSLSSPVASGDVKPLAYKAGDTVTVRNPRTGATTTLVSSASAAGDYSWTPDAGVGGTWTLTRTPSSGSAETATFTVASAAGTLADPVGVYTSAELDANKVDGGYYRLLGDAALTAPAGYKLFVAGDGVFWLTANQKSVAPTYSGNGTSSATATFHLHTATVSNNATTRELTSLSDLRPITYKAGNAVNLTAPSTAVLKAAEASDGEFTWDPAAIGTWIMTHKIGSVTYTATFKVGDSTAATGDYWLITWMLDSATVIDSTYVKSGAVPTHGTPVKASTDYYTYAFAGWTPSPAAASADATYTAQWTETKLLSTVSASVSAPAQTYDGTAKTPALSVTWNGSTALVQGTDYEITGWSSNIDVGTATVTIEGKGAYAGTVSGTFTISGIVSGASTIALGAGVTVKIPSGVTVTVNGVRAITSNSGTIVVTRGGVRAETTGTVAANGVITGQAVYLYSSQADVEAIRDLQGKTLDGGTLNIKAQE